MSARPPRLHRPRSSQSLFKPKPTPKVEEGPSFVDTLTENWLILVGGAALLILGLLGYNFFRAGATRTWTGR
jgi:hypothetical protein